MLTVLLKHGRVVALFIKVMLLLANHCCTTDFADDLWLIDKLRLTKLELSLKSGLLWLRELVDAAGFFVKMVVFNGTTVNWHFWQSQIKEPDLHFTVARALGNAALGPKSSAGMNKWRLRKDVKESGRLYYLVLVVAICCRVVMEIIQLDVKMSLKCIFNGAIDPQPFGALLFH